MWLLPSLAFASSDLPLPTRHPDGNPPVNQGGDAPAGEALAQPLTGAATLAFDCKVPAEMLVDGAKLGQLWFPGTASWKVTPGHHVVRVYVGGNPQDFPLDLREGQRGSLLVGRTGTTVSTDSGESAATPGPSRTGFRVIGVPAAQLRIDDHRDVVEAGTEFFLDLAPGSHPMSLRNLDGTAIWSTGVLIVSGGPVVVQVSEGRMPEVSGGAVYHSGG